MLFNEETGEIFEEGVPLVAGRYLQPLDISGVRNKETFDVAIKATVGRRNYKLWVSPFILDIIVERELSAPALGLLCFLGQNISYHTYVYLSTKEIVEGSKYVRQTVVSSLSELLEKHLVRKMSNKLEDKGDRFLALNPLYFYLGYYPNRDNVLKDWVGGLI
jgi:hypothetical protein